MTETFNKNFKKGSDEHYAYLDGKHFAQEHEKYLRYYRKHEPEQLKILCLYVPYLTLNDLKHLSIYFLKGMNECLDGKRHD